MMEQPLLVAEVEGGGCLSLSVQVEADAGELTLKDTGEADTEGPAAYGDRWLGCMSGLPPHFGPLQDPL